MRITVIILQLALGLFAPTVLANEVATQPTEDDPGKAIDSDTLSDPSAFLAGEYLTGDWWGARTALEESGIDLHLSLTAIYQHNVRGGLQTRNGHRITGSVDLELTLDLEAMGLLDGGVVYAYAESGWGNEIGADRVGSYFPVNADAIGDRAIRLIELWYEQTFFNKKARMRVGKLDLTVDFDANAYAYDETSQFMNAALVNAGNIPFPDYGLGAQFIVNPTDWLYLGLAAADAHANGDQTGLNTTFHGPADFFGVFEFGFLPVWQTPWGRLPGGYRFGIWYDPQSKEQFFDDRGGRRKRAPTRRDDIGFYTSLDQMVYKEVPSDDLDQQGLGLFFRYSYAHEDVNEIEHFWSLGAQYRGLIPTRDDDILGFGFAQGIISDQRHTYLGGDRESVYEVYYRIEVFPWLQISPDVQYIVNPGAAGGRNALVAGCRIQMGF
ncbi:MAG: carbohydrate porin [Phycisphaerales bacterium]|nr:carbohydrate porin [Phycisphaerales bacterium]